MGNQCFLGSRYFGKEERVSKEVFDNASVGSYYAESNLFLDEKTPNLRSTHKPKNASICNDLTFKNYIYRIVLVFTIIFSPKKVLILSVLYFE